MKRRYSPNRGLKEHIDAGRCVCGYARRLDAYVSNGCRLHPDVPTAQQVRKTREIAWKRANLK